MMKKILIGLVALGALTAACGSEPTKPVVAGETVEKQVVAPDFIGPLTTNQVRGVSPE